VIGIDRSTRGVLAPPEAVPIVAAPIPPDRNPALVYLAGKDSAVGRRGLQSSLDRAARILTGGLTGKGRTVNWAEVRYQHVAAMRAVLIEQGASPATINHTLAVVRGVVREAWRLDLIDSQVKERICDIKGVQAGRLPAGRHVDAGEMRHLFDYCVREDTPGGARDAAILALLYGCGLRRSEAVALQLADYDEGKVTVRHGKGNKERIVYCPAGGKAAVDAWIGRRGSWPGALLCPVTKGGRVRQRGMTAQAVMLRLRVLAERAKVTRLAPHDLRRSFVGELLDAGADISSVQKLAGHSNVATTQRYDRRPEAAKRRTAEMLHVPFSPPDEQPARTPVPSGQNEDESVSSEAESE